MYLLVELCNYIMWSFLDSPRVSIYPSNSLHTVSVGTRLILYCVAKGHPYPTIKWYQNDFLIPQQSQLLLVPTDFPHTTKYTCEGTNNAGNMRNNARASIVVIVESKNNFILYVV